jgi:Male sterility protein
MHTNQIFVPLAILLTWRCLPPCQRPLAFCSRALSVFWGVSVASLCVKWLNINVQRIATELIVDPPAVSPEDFVEPESCVGSGYPESKWVAERMFELAAQESSLRPIVVRITQVTGSVNGYWKAEEWVPSIVEAAVFVKCLPTMELVCLIRSSLHSSTDILCIIVYFLASVGYHSKITGRNAQLVRPYAPPGTS